MIESNAHWGDASLTEKHGPAHERTGENADVKANCGKDEESAKLGQESQQQAAVEAHLNLRRKIHEDQTRHDGGRNAAQRDRTRYDFGEWRRQITTAFLDLIHGRSDVRL